jgi:hypothetical protein
MKSDETAIRPVREAEAEAELNAITDPIARELVKLCMSAVRMRFMVPQGATPEERRNRLPVAPVDMQFLTVALAETLSKRQVIERILQGESIAAATGWDV